MSTKQDDYDPPSDAFKDAISTGGSLCAAECGFCGRVHFVSASGHGDYDDGELEGLKANAKAEPDKYIEEAVYDTIRTGWLDGREVVVDCQCHKIRRYEDWIWGNRDTIMSYLSTRAKAEQQAAGRVWERIKSSAKATRNAGRVLAHIEDAFRADREAGTLFQQLVEVAEGALKKASEHV